AHVARHSGTDVECEVDAVDARHIAPRQHGLLDPGSLLVGQSNATRRFLLGLALAELVLLRLTLITLRSLARLRLIALGLRLALVARSLSSGVVGLALLALGLIALLLSLALLALRLVALLLSLTLLALGLTLLALGLTLLALGLVALLLGLALLALRLTTLLLSLTLSVSLAL